MWLEGSVRMAAPQSVKRGRRWRMGPRLARQWASRLGEGAALGVGGEVRFAGWWMGERSDVGRVVREGAVGASARSRERS